MSENRDLRSESPLRPERCEKKYVEKKRALLALTQYDAAARKHLTKRRRSWSAIRPPFNRDDDLGEAEGAALLAPMDRNIALHQVGQSELSRLGALENGLGNSWC